MSYIIGKACDGVCDTICVSVCPVDCIHGPIDIDGAGMEVEGMSKEELKGKVFRRSIFVAQDIKKGQVFNISNLRAVRSSTQKSPKHF